MNFWTRWFTTRAFVDFFLIRVYSLAFLSICFSLVRDFQVTIRGIIRNFLDYFFIFDSISIRSFAFTWQSKEMKSVEMSLWKMPISDTEKSNHSTTKSRHFLKMQFAGTKRYEIFYVIFSFFSEKRSRNPFRIGHDHSGFRLIDGHSCKLYDNECAHAAHVCVLATLRSRNAHQPKFINQFSIMLLSKSFSIFFFLTDSIGFHHCRHLSEFLWSTKSFYFLFDLFFFAFWKSNICFMFMEFSIEWRTNLFFFRRCSIKQKKKTQSKRRRNA